MALVQCKACGGMVSKKAAACPHCGNPMKRKNFGCGTLIVFVLLLTVVMTVWQGVDTGGGSSAPPASRPATAHTPAAPPEPEPNWRARAEVSALDDSINVVLINQSINTIPDRFGRQNHAQLSLRCQEGRTEVLINWGQFITTQSARVTTRLGAGEAQTSEWNMSSNHEATFHRRPIDHIRELLEANEVLYQVTPHGQNPVRASFELYGLADEIDTLRQSCGW